MTRDDTSRPAGDDVLRQRLSAQLLTGAPATSAVDVVERITAVQAQDLRGFRLAVRARSSLASVADLDTCLTSERSLIVDWLCRGTLHLVRAEDHAWLHALTTPPIRAGNRRRLEQEGVSPAQAARGIAVVEQALREDGPQTRAALRDRLDAAGVPTARQALVHVLVAASLDGVCVRGPMVGGEQAFAHRREWLGPPPAVDRDAALVELARRFLAGHGPASDRDLARWSGLPLRDVRPGLAGIGTGLVERDDGLLALAGTGRDDGVPAPRLLGAFDPLLHGWVSRSPVLGPHGHGVVTSNGLFRPFALVDGQALATWGLAGGVVSWTPLPGERIAADVEAQLAADAARVLSYLGGS